MLIAKKIAKFNDAQSDSIVRKSLAKKKKAMMKICRQCLIFGKKNCEPPKEYTEEEINHPFYDPKGKYGDEILGAINNGYTYEEMEDFWNKLKGYANYLFNKSHSATYSVITLCTMYLKAKYPAKFLAALLSMQSKPEKIELYSKVAKSKGIQVKVPNINESQKDFCEVNGDILYGFNSIKGVGETSIPNIIECQPYNDVEDFINKLGKKIANKRVLTGLIKSGAFDIFNNNRYELFNQIYDIRKDKDDRYIPSMYNENICIHFEKEVLGTSLTYEEWWDTILDGDNFEQTFTLNKVQEKRDKKERLMCNAELSYQDTIIPTIVFSSIYNKTYSYWNPNEIKSITISGKKDKNKILVNDVLSVDLLEDNNDIEIDENII